MSNGNHRRNFLKTAARSAFFGLFVVTSAYMGRKNAKLHKKGCINRDMCLDCRAFNDCQLPRALSAKQFTRKKTNG